MLLFDILLSKNVREPGTDQIRPNR